MTRISTLFALAYACCLATTASAQYCKDGTCRLNPSATHIPSLRGPVSEYQRTRYGIGTDCRDGQCGLDGRNHHACHCDEQTCNCTPLLPENRYPGDYSPLTRSESPYRQTNFQAPAPPFDLRNQPQYRTQINWETDFGRGRHIARSAGRPMLVRVTADWCGHCTRMKQETFANAGIIRDIDSTFVAIDLDADQNRQLVQQMGIQSLPATLVISPDMRIVDREQGFRTVHQLSNVLRRHLRRAELQKDTIVACR